MKCLAFLAVVAAAAVFVYGNDGVVNFKIALENHPMLKSLAAQVSCLVVWLSTIPFVFVFVNIFSKSEYLSIGQFPRFRFTVRGRLCGNLE